MALAAICAASAAADDWPCWRGPARDGVSRETGWSTTGATLWRADIGAGYTRSVIQDGRLYTVGYRDASDSTERGEDTVVCLDALTGAQRWSVAHPALRLAFEHAGGTLSTPAIDGDRLFVMSREGVLRCLDADTGELAWSVDFTSELEADYKRYGFAGSPVVLGDRVFVNVDRAVALDRASGAILWHTDLLEADFSTPCPFTLAGRPCLAIFGGTGLSILDRADGARLHHHPWRNGPRNVEGATPIAIGESIFISSAYQHGGALLRFGGDGVEVVFHTRGMRTKMAGCVLWEDHLYGFDESMLKCIDLTGVERWRKRGLGNGSLMISDGRLIMMSSKGELVIAAADPASYRELGRTKLFDDGVFWSAPALADGLIYCRSSLGELVCLDHRASRPALAAAPRTPTPPADATLPAAGSLLARHLELIGGAEAVRRHDSMTMHGGFEMRSVGIVPTTATIHLRAPNLWRFEFVLPPTLGGATITEVFDGEHGWTINPIREDELLEPERLAELRRAVTLHADAEHATMYARMRTVARTSFDDRDCYEIAATSVDGVARRIYVDAETGLIAGRGSESESMTVLRDYRPFGDLLVPTYRKAFDRDTGIEKTWTIESVDYDAADASLFEMPEHIGAMVDDEPS